MRILIFSTAYLPLIGGAEIAVKEITDRLKGDFSFDLICARINRNLPSQEKVGGVNIYRSGWGWGKIDKLLLPWRGAALANKLHRENNYQAIWAIMASFGGLAAMMFKNKNQAVPYLLTLQEGDTPEHIAARAKWLGPYFKKIFTSANFITAISNYLAQWAREIGYRRQLAVVPNGVNLENYQSTITNYELKRKLGFKHEEKIIVTTSRLVEKNGIGDLLEAMKYLPKEVKLLVIGSGPLEIELKLKISNLKLADRVKMLGVIDNQAVPQYLALANVFVRPSLAEGLGISFLEAMAAGVPVVATPVGGIIDFLRDGETGLFCEVKNPKSVAEKVTRLLTDKKLAEEIKANAREMIKNNYDWDLIALKMKAIFLKLLK